MPTYEYQCKNCGFQLEELQSFNEPPLLHCPNCNKDTLDRVLGGGAGLIFKGSGFYLTDYKNTGGSPESKGKNDTKQEGTSGDKKSEPSTPSTSSDKAPPPATPPPSPPPPKQE